MARWEPHASERLVAAALDLFAEQGYEKTTVIEIAERAGLTKSTFFRHFPDKREVLFGGTAMNDLLVAAIAGAPAGTGALEAVSLAMDAAGSTVFTAARREFAARRWAVIAANPDLQEREALKGLGLIASIIDALKARGVPDLTARVSAELGALAMKLAYERWAGADSAGGAGGTSGASGAPEEAGDEAGFGEIARRALDEVLDTCAAARRAAEPPARRARPGAAGPRGAGAGSVSPR